MKLVQEHIFEKFVEDSDPISDMGIGLMPQIKKFVKEETDYSGYYKKDLLWICAEYGKLEFVKYLLEDDIDIHHWNDAALRFASERAHPEVVKVLLDAGADVHADDDVALRRASEYGHTEVVKVLLNAGADVHAGDDAALRWASRKGHAEVVKVLKDHIAKEKKTDETKIIKNMKRLNEKEKGKYDIDRICQIALQNLDKWIGIADLEYFINEVKDMKEKNEDLEKIKDFYRDFIDAHIDKFIDIVAKQLFIEKMFLDDSRDEIVDTIVDNATTPPEMRDDEVEKMIKKSLRGTPEKKKVEKKSYSEMDQYELNKEVNAALDAKDFKKLKEIQPYLKEGFLSRHIKDILNEEYLMKPLRNPKK